MTPADRRITEQIDKWLVSVDLHLKYVELSDAAYARAQPWPKHDRPTRWVLEVARQKLLELKGHVETRQAMGDAKFSESLELMAFLANLVGIQHIQRFVPLADPALEGTGTGSTGATTTQATLEATVIKPTVQQQRPRSSGDETTREMPKVRPAQRAADAPVREPMAPAAVPGPRPGAAKAPARGAANQSRAGAAKSAAAARPAPDRKSVV